MPLWSCLLGKKKCKQTQCVKGKALAIGHDDGCFVLAFVGFNILGASKLGQDKALW